MSNSLSIFNPKKFLIITVVSCVFFPLDNQNSLTFQEERLKNQTFCYYTSRAIFSALEHIHNKLNEKIVVRGISTHHSLQKTDLHPRIRGPFHRNMHTIT
jgi:hypothetical protein